MPNINITNCDFTIAFWIKATGTEGPIVAAWSTSGKLFYIAIKRSIVFLSAFNTLGKAHFRNSDWNHIGITCEQFKIKVFVNGSKKALGEQWNEYYLFPYSERYEPYHVIANNPVLLNVPLVTQPFVGSVMDLYVVEKALSVNEIINLFKGKMHQ